MKTALATLSAIALVATPIYVANAAQTKSTTATKSVATPANWKQGEDVIILTSVSDEAAKEKFPGGWKTLKPYLRLVPQPGAK